VKYSHFVRSSVLLLGFAFAAVAQPPAGRFEPPKTGELLSGFLQQRLNLSADQKKELADFQKDVDARLAKLLTDEQKKTLKDMRERPGFGPGPIGGPGGFPGGGFGAPGGFGTVRLDDVRKSLEATEEEWKVLGPKLQKVIAARQVLATESRSTPDAKAAAKGDAPRPAPGGATEANIITQAHADFKAVLDDPKHTKTEIQEAAAAVRKARDKARANLVDAQKDLRQLLTAGQETILLGLGYLD
jgi:hypothetical protein